VAGVSRRVTAGVGGKAVQRARRVGRRLLDSRQDRGANERSVIISAREVVIVTSAGNLQVDTAINAAAPSVGDNESFHICPCCLHGSFTFKPYGPSRRPAASCPSCGSLERHRFLWLCLNRLYGDLLDGSRILHFAPEPAVQRLLAKRGGSYLRADLDETRADVQADITDMAAFEDGSYDVIVCSHVLEHVPDDAAALRELRRLLAPGGVAFLMVPQYNAQATFEDPSITDPEERKRAFGQADHVRRYGRDFSDRVRASGFALTEHTVGAVLTPEEARVFRCDRASGSVFAARHPAPFR
jgi:SAM-dependent methyltransferase